MLTLKQGEMSIPVGEAWHKLLEPEHVHGDNSPVQDIKAKEDKKDDKEGGTWHRVSKLTQN